MINQKDVLFFLTEKDGRCRQVKNGVVTSLNAKVPLPHAPVGTDEISILWERNLVKLIQVRTFGLPLGFVREGYTILKNDMFSFSLNRELFLNIVFLSATADNLFYYIQYNYLYKGQLDISTAQDLKGQRRVNVSIMEGGLSKLLKAQETTKFPIQCLENFYILEDDGITLYKLKTWSIPADTEFSKNTIIEFAMPVFNKAEEGVTGGVLLFDQNFEEVDDHFDYLATSPNYLILLDDHWPTDVDCTISGKIQVLCTQGLSSVYGSLQLRLLKQDGTAFENGDPNPTGRILKTPEESMVAGKVYTFEFTMTGTLHPGDKVFLIAQMFQASIVGEDMVVKILDMSDFSVNFNTRQATTYTRIKHPWQVFKDLVKAISGSEDNAASSILPTSTYFLRCGNWIRGANDATFAISMQDFCKAYDIYHFGAYGVSGNKIRFEGRGYAFDTSIAPVELGKMREVEVNPAVDLMYTDVKFGHQDQDLSDVNSKNDFNGWHTYKFPLTGIGAKTLDMQSIIKAGPMEQEEIRINLTGKPTTVDASDNNIFAADVVSQTIRIEGAMSFVQATKQITLPTVSNVFAGAIINVIGTAHNDGQKTVLAVSNNIITVSEDLENEITDDSIIDLVDGIFVKFRRDEIPDSGVQSPTTIYNVGLRVSKLFKLHGPWFRSWLFGFDLENITFLDANSNKNLVVAGEKDIRDFPVGALGDIMFYPWYVSGEPITPANLNDIFEGNINMPLAAIIEGTRQVGHVWGAGFAPRSKKPQTFKFLLWPNADLAALKK